MTIIHSYSSNIHKFRETFIIVKKILWKIFNEEYFIDLMNIEKTLDKIDYIQCKKFFIRSTVLPIYMFNNKDSN